MSHVSLRQFPFSIPRNDVKKQRFFFITGEMLPGWIAEPDSQRGWPLKFIHVYRQMHLKYCWPEPSFQSRLKAKYINFSSFSQSIEIKDKTCNGEAF
jgi:hypothetical protein